MPGQGLKGRRFPPELLTHAEIMALLAVCPSSPSGQRNRALIVLCWRAGLRISEALDLRACDVNLDDGYVRVLHGKGDVSRTVGLDPAAGAEVAAWIAVRTGEGIGAGPLLCRVRAPAGGRLANRYVRAAMTRLGAKAGIEHRVHCHGLRHSMAVELSREGWPLRLIQQQLGHADLRTTSIYLDHLSPGEVIDRARVRVWA